MTAQQIFVRTVLALFFLSFGALSPATAQSDSKGPPAVFAMKAKEQPITDTIEALGTLRANESVELTSNITEIISKVHFEDGLRVKKGDVLVEMTSAEEQALFEEARSTAREAERQYERIQPLLKRGAAPASVVDQQKREFETAKARLQAIESRLEDRLIKAPFSGIVGLRLISAGALVNPGDVVATLDDDSVMKLDFPVPSGYLPHLKPGLTIQATASAIDGLTVEGEVSSIDSRVDPVTRSVLVRAILPNEEKVLKPGLLMKVRLSKSPRRAIMVSESAIIPEGDDTFVYVATPQGENYLVEKRKVETGARKPGVIEITEGLRSGENVIIHGTLKARPGAAVSISRFSDGTESLQELLKPNGTGN